MPTTVDAPGGEEGALTETDTDATASRADRIIASTAAVSVVATVAVATVPFLRFVYDNVSLHVALETSEALIGALLAFLAFGRHRVTRHPADLVLGWAFAILSVTNLLLAAAPSVVEQGRVVGFATWASAGLRFMGAAGIAAAAVLGARAAVPPAESPARIARVAGGTVIAVLGLALVAEAVLGPPIEAAVEATASNRPTLIGHPIILVIQVAGFAVYGLAALAFRRRAHVGDTLMLWFAVGCVLAAFSRVHYFLFASLYTSWVSTGDVVRLASYLAFLTGAAGEIGAYWRAQRELGATRERGRLARELHDGLTQELSFIRSQTVGRSSIEGSAADAVAEAAGRALLESRRLIRLLSDLDGHDVEAELREAVLVVAGRVGATVDVAVSGDVDQLLSTYLTALIRVAREAAGNATRHGRASHVQVTLDVDQRGGSLRVEDDGVGFDPSLPTNGFGLASMRSRAAEIGGALHVRSTAGSGTVVEVRW